MLRIVLILSLLCYATTLQAQNLPRLLQVISPDCHSCRFLQSELNSLRSLDAGRLTIDTLNIAKEPAEAQQLKVYMVPTLIFFDINGKELFRHHGEWSAAEIRRKWHELGVELYAGPGH